MSVRVGPGSDGDGQLLFGGLGPGDAGDPVAVPVIDVRETPSVVFSWCWAVIEASSLIAATAEGLEMRCMKIRCRSGDAEDHPVVG